MRLTGGSTAAGSRSGSAYKNENSSRIPKSQKLFISHVFRLRIRNCVGIVASLPANAYHDGLNAGGNMRRIVLVTAFSILGASMLMLANVPQQPAQSPSNGEVIALIQWMTTGDLDKSEQFFHGLMGLESLGGDPRMRLGWYGVVPFLTEMYQVKGNARNFSLRIPGTDMGVEPIQWSEAKGKPLPSRVQDPGAGHLILNTWNIDAFMERITKGDVQILSAGRKPVTVAGQNGRNRILWMRQPNGFFVALMQPDPPPPSPGANGAPSPTWYLGAHAGFAVQDTETTVRFYRDVLGLQVQTGE